MADSAVKTSAPSRPYSPGIENLNPVASTSAQTLDSAATSGSNSVSLPRPPVSHDSSLTTTPIITSSSTQSTDLPATDTTLPNTTGLNEEDAKLLASLSEGNGLFTQLSSLAQAQNVDGILSSFNTPTKQLGSDDLFGTTDQYQGAVDLNEALTRTDMDWDDDLEDPEPEEGDDQDQGPIQAYAKLEFPGFSYYVQTLDVSIGRRPGQLQQQAPGMAPPQLPNAASGFSRAHITSESKAEGDVDVDLGPLKSISRLHARIFYYTGPIQPSSTAFPAGPHARTMSGPYQQNVTPYRITSPSALSRLNGGLQDGSNGDANAALSASDPEQGDGQFVLSVVGRNGAFVDDVWVEKGGLVVLGKRTKIQIAERVFYFVLPPPPGADLSADERVSGSDSLSSFGSEDDEEASEDNESSEAEQDSQDEHGSDAQASDGSFGNPPSAKAKVRRPSAAQEELDTPRRRLVLKPKSKVISSTPNTAVGRIHENKSKANGRTLGRGKSATTDGDPEDDDDSLGTPSAEEEEADEITQSASSKASKRRVTQANKGTKHLAHTKGRKGKQAPTIADTEMEEASVRDEGSTSRKRKHGEANRDDEPALKVGTPIGVEALQANKRAATGKAGKSLSSSKQPSKAKNSDDDDVVMLDSKTVSAADSNADSADVSAKGKAAKAKATKSKKKKGTSDEQAPVHAGFAPIAPAPAPTPNGTTQVLPSLNTAGVKASTTPSSTAAPAEADIKPAFAANAAPNQTPGTSQIPRPHVLPSPLSGAGSRPYQSTPSSVPTIPGPIATTAKYTGGPPTGFKTEPVSSSSPHGSVLPSGLSAPPSSSWPSTASIIASAASLANAQTKPPGTTSSSPNNYPPATHKFPAGPDDKPDISNIDLISQALRSEHCMKKGAKLTLQEVYEWIANRWAWFGRNGRQTGRDWQSSIRHAIGSSRDFTRIPRRSNEPGKGIFYTMSNSTLAQRHRENLAKQKDEAAKASAGTPLANSSSAAVKAAAAGIGLSGAATAATSATPSSLPAIKIPLIIGTPPSAATSAAAKDNPKAAPGTIESLLETPPIVHHDGKLYLSPQVFGHLNAGQLAQIESLGAQQALQVLQAYLVTHLKERMRQQQQQPKAPTTTTPSPAAPSGTGTNVDTKVSLPVTQSASLPARPSVPSTAPLPPRPILPGQNKALGATASTTSAGAFSPRTTPIADYKPVSTPPVRPVPAASEVVQTTPAKAGVGTPAPPQKSPSREPSASPAPLTLLSIRSGNSGEAQPVTAASASPAPTTATSEDPLSALSALAAHPEAAGLIALLRKQQEGGGGQMAKLTPGQLQLLQMANKLAAQQKKSKKKKKNKEGTSTPGGPASGSPAPAGSPTPTAPPSSTAQATASADAGDSKQSS